MTIPISALALAAALAAADPPAAVSGAEQVRRETLRAVGGQASDDFDFRQTRAAIDNSGMPICVLRQRRRPTIDVVHSAASPDCDSSLRDVTVVDASGHPIPGARLVGSDALRSDTHGKLVIPKSERLCGAVVYGEGWRSAAVPPHAAHARVTLSPGASVHLDLHAGPVACPTPHATFDPAPAAPDKDVWSPGPGWIYATNLPPGRVDATVECGIKGIATNLVELQLAPQDDNSAEANFVDPSMAHPENHFSIKGTLHGKVANAAAKVRVRCGDVIRVVEVAPDGRFEVAHLPQAARCGVRFGDAAKGGMAVVPSPSENVALELP